MAEPSAAIGFEWVWKLAFVVFSQTKSWFYKIFAALVAVPAALLWAVVFALVTVVYIWIVSPALRLLDLSLAVVKKVSYFYSYLQQKLYTLAADKVLCLKNAGTQISMFFTSNE